MNIQPPKTLSLKPMGGRPALLLWALALHTGVCVRVFHDASVDGISSMDSAVPSGSESDAPSGGKLRVLGEEALSPTRDAEDHTVTEFRFYPFWPVVVINACSKSSLPA